MTLTKHMKIQKFNQIDYYIWLVRQVVDKNMDLSDVMEILQDYYQIWFNNYYKKLSGIREKKKQLDSQIVNMQRGITLNINSVNNYKQVLNVIDEKIKNYDLLYEIDKEIIFNYKVLEEEYENKRLQGYVNNNTKKTKKYEKKLHELKKRQYFVLEPGWKGSRVVPVYEDTPAANSDFKGRYYYKYFSDNSVIFSKYGQRMEAAKRVNSILTYKYVIAKIRKNLEAQANRMEARILLNDAVPRMEKDIETSINKLNKMQQNSRELVVFDMLWNNIMN